MSKSIRIRSIREDDLSDLARINGQMGLFPFPDLDSPLYIIKGVVEDETGKILGAGFIKLTAEAIIMIEPELPRIEKVQALKELFLVGKMESLKKGIYSWHAFIKGSKKDFANTLRKTFGFEEIEDTVLFLNLEG